MKIEKLSLSMIDRIIIHDLSYIKQSKHHLFYWYISEPKIVKKQTDCFSGYLYIEKKENFFTKKILDEIPFEYVFLNMKTNDIFSISSEIKDFLYFFRHSAGIPTIQQLLVNFDFDDEFYRFLMENDFLKTITNIISTKHINISVDSANIMKLLPSYDFLETICNDRIKASLLIKNKSGKKYIVKYIKNNEDEKILDTFNNEFTILKKLNNNALSYKVICHDSEKGYAIVEYIEGINLIDYLLCNNLTVTEKMDIINRIVRILSFIHKKNIVHGDIHIGQFMIDKNRNIKILDFELSRDLDCKNDINVTGGIYEYLEPEFMSANPIFFLLPCSYNKIAEIYRLGVLMYFIIYEEHPFSAVSWKQLYEKKMFSIPFFPATTKGGEKVPVFLINIIRRCLHKSPSARFESVETIKMQI
jgi:serine/threonine-protein kinase